MSAGLRDGPPRRVVICGATGFIGRNLAEHLSAQPQAWSVTGVYHRRLPFSCPGLSWVRADLTRPAEVRRALAGADVVLHAAAETSGVKDIVERPEVHVTGNSVMNALVLRTAHDLGVGHLLFLSCTVMYPDGPEAMRERDLDPARPLRPAYFGVGWTKLYAERMCEFYAGLGRTRFTAVRHSNVYGPHDKFDLDRGHVFGATVAKVLRAPAGGRVVIWGSGEERRDLLHAEDLARFVDLALARQRRRFGLYNCGSGRSVRVADLVRRIVQLSGRPLDVVCDPGRPSIAASIAIDSRRAEAELGWRALIGLDEGIARTLAWCRSREAGGSHATGGQ